MLIRSQSGDCLLNLKCTTLIGLNEGLGGFILVAVSNGKEYKIAKYSTQQKALKVFDMIEKEYLAYGTIGNKNVGITSAFTLPKVFGMPADEEVEV